MVAVAFSKSAAVAAVAFLASVDAHMMMSSPVPYGKSSLNNSPLAADGSDFPCKQRTGVYDAEGASNVAAIGDPQTLSFIGGATHGGGSCQVSLTTDLKPTKDSKWMVIKSIEGGCPSSAPGNLNGDPKSTGAATFQYTIPEGIAPGDYTIAWTWFNHLGNREMYMNCGPQTVTAAKKKRYAPAPKVVKRQSSSFPDMFVANIGGCTIPDSVDLVFPNPGADVQTAGTGPFATPTCDSGKGGVGAAQQPTGSAPAAGPPAAATNGGGASPPAPTGAPTSAPGFASGNNGQYSQAPAGGDGSVPTPVPTPSSSANGNQVIPVTPAAGQTFTPIAPAGTAPVAAAPTDTAGGSSVPATGGSSAGKQSGPCSNEGEWNCIDGTSFQRCASGAWSVAIPMSGMTCTPGETSNFVMAPANKAKRFEGFRQDFNPSGFRSEFRSQVSPTLSSRPSPTGPRAQHPTSA